MTAYEGNFPSEVFLSWKRMYTTIFDLLFGEPISSVLLLHLFSLNVFCLLSSDTLPEGLVRELPTADDFQKPAAEAADTNVDDLEELRKQLDALNS